MVETALVMGLIAVLMVSTIYIIADWVGTTFMKEAKTTSQQSEFNTQMTSLSGNITINSTTVATTSTISGGMTSGG